MFPENFYYRILIVENQSFRAEDIRDDLISGNENNRHSARPRMKRIRKAGNISEKPVFPKKCWTCKSPCDRASGVQIRAKSLFSGRHTLRNLSSHVLQGFGGIGSNFGKPLSINKVKKLLIKG